MGAKDTEEPSSSGHPPRRGPKAAAGQREALLPTLHKITLRTAPTQPNPEWIAILEEAASSPQVQEDSMNATTFTKKLNEASFDHASSLLLSVFDSAAKNLQAFSDAFAAGVHGAEQARTHVVETASRTLSDQIAAAAQIGKVSAPDEAWKLQQQLARGAWEFHAQRARGLGEVVWAAWQASTKPLTERCSEISRNPAG